MDYYGDNDRSAAAWLRELVKEGLIPDGTVEERDIQDLGARDLAGFRRVHLFAGIGGWAYAFELAGWPRERPVWSGSCPCQPFSAAGKRKGQADERHLWPVFLRLIRECRPATVFGEQVASDDGYRWLARVRDDLEAAGYAVGCADLPACSEGSPEIRQRLWWVASAGSQRCNGKPVRLQQRRSHKKDAQASRRGHDADRLGRAEVNGAPDNGQAREPDAERHGPAASGLGGATGAGPQEQWREYRPGGERCSGLVGLAMQAGVPQWNGPTVAALCSDGPRRVSAQPDAFPLASGLPGRVALLRGAGNSIVPEVAAKFIRAFLEAEAELA